MHINTMPSIPKTTKETTHFLIIHYILFYIFNHRFVFLLTYLIFISLRVVFTIHPVLTRFECQKKKLII